jgi:hypothetical protein
VQTSAKFACVALPCNHTSSERGDRAKLNARLIRNFSSAVSGFSALISEICSLTLGAKNPLILHSTDVHTKSSTASLFVQLCCRGWFAPEKA